MVRACCELWSRVSRTWQATMTEASISTGMGLVQTSAATMMANMSGKLPARLRLKRSALLAT